MEQSKDHQPRPPQDNPLEGSSVARDELWGVLQESGMPLEQSLQTLFSQCRFVLIGGDTPSSRQGSPDAALADAVALTLHGLKTAAGLTHIGVWADDSLQREIDACRASNTEAMAGLKEGLGCETHVMMLMVMAKLEGLEVTLLRPHGCLLGGEFAPDEFNAAAQAMHSRLADLPPASKVLVITSNAQASAACPELPGGARLRPLAAALQATHPELVCGVEHLPSPAAASGEFFIAPNSTQLPLGREADPLTMGATHFVFRAFGFPRSR